MAPTPSSPPDDFADARDAIFPAIRSLAALERARLEAQIEQGEELERIELWDFGGSLGVTIVHDTGPTHCHVPRAQLARWDPSEDALLDCAIENLRARSDGRWKQVHPGVFQSPWQDELDASRLLLRDVAAMAGVKGRPCAVTPCATELYLAERDDPAAVDALAQIVATGVSDIVRPVAPTPLILTDDGQWIDWDCDDDPPIPDAFARLAIAERVRWYEAQRPLLQRWLADRVHVAELLATVDPDGSFQLVTTVAEGVPTLVPDAHMVLLVSEDPEPREPEMLPWDVFQERMAPEQTRDFPPRWLVAPHEKPERVAKTKRRKTERR